MDPGWLVVGVPWAALALLLLVVLPGVALGPVLAPGPVSPIERLGRVLGGGILVSSAAMLGLALSGMLRPTIVVAVLVGLTILPLHGRRPERPSAGRLTTRRRVVMAAIPVAIVVAFPALLAGPGGGLGSLPAEWAGSSAAASLATSGGLPVVAPAWAAERLLRVPELPGVAHLAAVVHLLPGDMLVRLRIDRLAMTAIVLVVAAALLRRWLPSWTAALGAGLFVGLGSVATPVLDDAAGSRTVALALFALWLTDRALVDRHARLVVSAGLAAGLVLVGRPDAFLATCAGIAGLASARWLVAPGGGPENAGGLGHRHGRRLGLRFSARRTAFAPISAALVVVAIGGGAGGVVDRLVRLADPAGDVQGIASGDASQAPFVGVGEVPEGWLESGDDTWDLQRAALEPLAATDAAPRTETDPRFVAAASAGLLAAAGTVPAGLPLAIGGALVLPLAGWPLLDARRQRLVVAWLVFGSSLAFLAVAVLARGGPFADRWLGAARLLPFEALVAGTGLASAAWLGCRELTRLARRVARGRIVDAATPRHALTGVVAATVVGAVTVGMLLVGTVRGAVDRPGALSERGAQVYAWLARELPPDARILVNAPTDGVIAVLTGRTGILDGPLANAADRPLLARATALALGARVVFAEPNGARAAAYLAREGVTHLLVAVPGSSVADVGGRVAFDTDIGGIGSGDRFALVRSFDDRVLLFEVRVQP